MVHLKLGGELTLKYSKSLGWNVVELNTSVVTVLCIIIMMCSQ